MVYLRDPFSVQRTDHRHPEVKPPTLGGGGVGVLAVPPPRASATRKPQHSLDSATARRPRTKWQSLQPTSTLYRSTKGGGWSRCTAPPSIRHQRAATPPGQRHGQEAEDKVAETSGHEHPLPEHLRKLQEGGPANRLYHQDLASSILPSVLPCRQSRPRRRAPKVFSSSGFY